MKRLIYLYPAFFNFIIAGTVYFGVQRLTDAGAPKLLISATMPTWALIYCCFNLVMGKVTTEKNALPFLFAGCMVIIIGCSGFLVVHGLYWQFLWIALVGAGTGLYCAPFQIFLKSRERGKTETAADVAGVARAAGIYTASWSFGFGTAPLVFGRLRPVTGFSLSIALMALMLFGLFWQKNNGSAEAVTKTPEQTAARATGNPPDLAWIGWVVGGVGTLTVCLIRIFWQPRGAELHLPGVHVDCVLALVSYVLGITALCLSRSRRWFFRSAPGLAVGAAGVIAFLLFAGNVRLPFFYLAAIIGGVYFGAVYFLLVFYSLNHPTKAAFNVGINEIIVSVTSISGPLAGGWVADRFGLPVTFVLGAFCVVLAALFHALALFRLRTTLNVLEKGKQP